MLGFIRFSLSSNAQECSAVETRTAVFCENALSFTGDLDIGDLK